MGIYYYAVDVARKKFFSAPSNFAIKAPGIYHPENPFPGMVVMKNTQGYGFEIWDDCSQNVPPENDYEEITEKVYEEYLNVWKEKS